MIYLDNNATTPLDPRVLEVMMPYLTDQYGNAASVQHAFGWRAADAVDLAREQVAALIGSEKQEIIFTSGATESDNLAIKGIYEAYHKKGKHIITVKTEHKAVLDTCANLEKYGADITYLDVDKEGKIDLTQLENSIREDTILVAVMYANNETGVVQDIQAISEIAHSKKVIFFSDATQAVGKIPVKVLKDNVDMMALSGHKIYGPKGIGALYVRRRSPRVTLTEQINGGGHERGMRSGTLNVPAIAGLGRACELCMQEMAMEIKRIAALRDRLENTILVNIPDVVVNGDQRQRIPETTNISFLQPDSNQLLAAFKSDLAVSAGSACTSASNEPSYVLEAMGLGLPRAKSAIRFGLGRFTTEAEIDFTADFVIRTVRALRKNILR